MNHVEVIQGALLDKFEENYFQENLFGSIMESAQMWNYKKIHELKSLCIMLKKTLVLSEFDYTTWGSYVSQRKA